MTCPHWKGQCRHIGEALPFTGTISPLHHHKTRQLGRQHASCHLQCFQWHLSHRTSPRSSVGLRSENSACKNIRLTNRPVLLFELAACTIWKEVDALNRRVLRLLMILARKLAIPPHQWIWQTIQLCYNRSIYAHTVNRVTCQWFQWALSCSTLTM